MRMLARSGLMMGIVAALLGMTVAKAVAQAQPDFEIRPTSPTLTVSGHGETAAAPDRSVLQLGATEQAPQAAAAQNKVNEIMQRALDGIKALGIAEKNISTAALTLTPLYEQPKPRLPQQPEDESQPHAPRIVGYQAGQTLRVSMDNLKQVGDVIDAAVKAGANQIEGLTFDLKDDTAARQTALRQAAGQARAKAQAMAEALGVQLLGVNEVVEGGVDVIRPQPMMMGRKMAMAAEAATPVQPGQVQIEANVTVRYRIAPAPGGTAAPSAPAAGGVAQPKP